MKNDNAAKTIEQACREIFDTNHIDDEYNDCLLREMPRAETDKDVNIILRLCLMKKFAK